MNPYENLAKKFADRSVVKGTTMTLINEPLLIPKMKRADLDFLVFDMEHGRYDCQDILPMLAMCRYNQIPTIVRVQDSLYHLIAKTIDMGADGIMLPRTETVEQLRTAVDAIRFYPIGRKGCGGTQQFRPGENFDEFQRGRLLMPQIESPLGIENLPAMIAGFKDQLAGIMIGPYDMSIMLGTPLDIASVPMTDAIKKVFDICITAGVSVGCYCDNPEKALYYRSMGSNIFWTGGDTGFFLSGLNKMMDELKAVK